MGLGDLLQGLGAEFLDDLPGPQRLALNATLLRADAPSEGLDHRTICVAVLASLRTMAASAPLLIAIDDVQWLDGPTALVLQFIARRLTDAPIRFIAALRAAADGSDPVDLARTLGEGHVRTIDLKGLSCDSLNMLFQERLDATFPRPTLNHLLEVSGGNALLALEIARALIAGRLQLEPGRMVSMPPDLADLVRAHLAQLPPSIQELLLMCSAASAPTTELLRSAAADRDRVSSELATAVRAGVIDLEGGRIRSHTHCSPPPCIRRLPRTASVRSTAGSRPLSRTPRSTRGTSLLQRTSRIEHRCRTRRLTVRAPRSRSAHDRTDTQTQGDTGRRMKLGCVRGTSNSRVRWPRGRGVESPPLDRLTCRKRGRLLRRSSARTLPTACSLDA
jgi:hypothetical protein